MTITSLPFLPTIFHNTTWYRIISLTLAMAPNLSYIQITPRLVNKVLQRLTFRHFKTLYTTHLKSVLWNALHYWLIETAKE